MKKVKKVLGIILLIVIVCGGCFFAGKFLTSSGENQRMSTVVLQEKLVEISELATVNYSYTNMAEFENSKVFYGVTVPFTTKGFILTYDGEIKAGLDLSKAEIDVSGRTVTITLPDAEILSHEIDEESIEIFDESTSIFNPFKVDDYAAFCTDQKKEMEKKAKEKGFLTEAKEKAISSIEGLFAEILEDGYTLEVK